MKAIQENHNRVENIGPIGRILRISAGVALLVPVFTVSGPVGGLSVLALLAILPVLCGIDGYCPLTAWLQKIMRTQQKAMTRSERISLAALASVLIGSVFFMQGHSLGIWALLPLAGIYPAIVAIFGTELFGELLHGSRDEEKVSGDIVNFKLSKQYTNHGSVGHAA